MIGAGGEQYLKFGGRSRVELGTERVAKHYLSRGPCARLWMRLGRGPAARARRAATLLARLGLETPPVLSLAVPGRAPGAAATLETARLRGARTLAALCQDPWVDGLRPRRLARELGRSLARLHGAGLVHGDLKAANLLVAGGRLHFTDLDSLRRVTPGPRIEDWDQLASTIEAPPRLALAALWAYGRALGLGRFERRLLASRIAEAAVARRARRAARGRAVPRRILIVRLSAIGDVVHTLPAVAAIKAAWPDCHIAWACEAPALPLLIDNPVVDEAILVPRWGRGAGGRELAALRRRLRRGRYDLALDFQGLARSALIALLSGARLRIGHSQAREGAWWAYHRVQPFPHPDLHAVDRNRLMLESLGLDPLAAAPRFPLPPPAPVDGRPRGHGAIAIFPGCGKEANRYPPELMARLLVELSALGHPLAVLGGPGDRPLAEAIREAAGGRWPVPCRDLTGALDLRATLDFLREAALAVGGDTGPLHLAAAAGRPVVALFGPASPQRTRPYSAAARVLVGPAPCRPCFRRLCPLPWQICVQAIAPRDVARACAELLALVYGIGSGPL